jgi:transcription initiation factor IIE alpha subunit
VSDNIVKLIIFERMNYYMTITTTTQTAKVANALVNGAELTAKQISARYGVKNVRAVISQLRSEGFSIYLNRRVSSYDGETYMKYRMGTASRAVVAAGIQALRAA